MAGIKMSFIISREAYNLIQSGKAKISSGGVRLNDGKLFEMCKPSLSSRILSGVASTVGATGKIAASTIGALLSMGGGGIINLASSLAANVQCSFIQKGVEAANMKLDDVLVRLGRMENALQGLGQIQALSWVTASFSLANCGISIAGFCMTLSKLDQIGGQIKEFYRQNKKDRQDDIIERWYDLLLNLKGDMSYLQDRRGNSTFTKQGFESRSGGIEEHLNGAASFLRKIINEFKERRIDGKIGCEIIFTLTAAYVQTVNGYCCQYYYVHGERRDMYSEWCSVLDEIDSEAFKAHLRMHLAFDSGYAEATETVRKGAYKVALEAISQQKNQLAVCWELLPQMDEQQYLTLDELLNQRVLESIVYQIPERQGRNVDEILMERIELTDIKTEEADELIEIPLL